MSAKNLIIAAVITTLLAGCGGNAANQTALPGDYADPTVVDSGSDYSSDTTGDYDSTGDLGGTTTPEDPAASPSASPAAGTGYAFKGRVLDANGAALVSAKVSIGAASVLTDSSGNFEITGITDTKIYVNVSKDGYDSVNQETVSFTDSTPSVSKDFKLVVKGSSSNDDSTASGLEHELTYTTAKFKTVSGMVVADNQVYVLGLQDGLLFDTTAVAIFDGSTGDLLSSFKKTGFLTHLPKDVTGIKRSDDQIVVGNGETNYTYTLTGDFVSKASGSRPAIIDEVYDDDRDIKYEIDTAKKVKITYKSTTKTYELEDIGSAKALGLDDDGHLLVLDGSAKTVQQYSFNP